MLRGYQKSLIKRYIGTYVRLINITQSLPSRSQLKDFKSHANTRSFHLDTRKKEYSKTTCTFQFSISTTNNANPKSSSEKTAQINNSIFKKSYKSLHKPKVVAVIAVAVDSRGLSAAHTNRLLDLPTIFTCPALVMRHVTPVVGRGRLQ